MVPNLFAPWAKLAVTGPGTGWIQLLGLIWHAGSTGRAPVQSWSICWWGWEWPGPHLDAWWWDREDQTQSRHERRGWGRVTLTWMHKWGGRVSKPAQFGCGIGMGGGCGGQGGAALVRTCGRGSATQTVSGCLGNGCGRVAPIWAHRRSGSCPTQYRHVEVDPT